MMYKSDESLCFVKVSKTEWVFGCLAGKYEKRQIACLLVCSP